MKIKNLLKNPAKGGIPPKENMDSIMTKANFGFDLYKPLKAEIKVLPLE
jgi:hypothetical protein